MAPRRRSELYRVGVGAAALLLFAGGLPELRSARPDWILVALLGPIGLLALRFPLHVSLSNKVSVASAVFFAAALLMPAGQAAALVAGVSAVDVLITVARRVLASREAPPFRSIAVLILFNAGQGYLSILAAGLVLASAHTSMRAGVGSASGALTMAAAAAVMFVLNMLFVSTAVALATSRNPWSVFSTTQKVVIAEFAGLYVLGTAAAFAIVHLPWLLVLGVLPAILVYRSLQFRIELRRDTVRAMERMAEEVDSRDPYTFQHSQRVARYAREIAHRLRMSAAEVELIELAAKVHDIGKIRIPDSILLKPDRLTDAETRVMETHPRLGYEILSQFAEYAKVLELVLTHHERYDGAGYPNRIVGRRLLLIAQVIPVADSLDAMTTGRAYRGPHTWGWALDELRRGAGTQWNPHVVAAAIDALRRDESPVADQAAPDAASPAAEPAAAVA